MATFFEPVDWYFLRFLFAAELTGRKIRLCAYLGLQTQGLMRTTARLLGVEIEVPDVSTLSRRSNGLILRAKLRLDNKAAIHLPVDSTGI